MTQLDRHGEAEAAAAEVRGAREGRRSATPATQPRPRPHQGPYADGLLTCPMLATQAQLQLPCVHMFPLCASGLEGALARREVTEVRDVGSLTFKTRVSPFRCVANLREQGPPLQGPRPARLPRHRVPLLSAAKPFRPRGACGAGARGSKPGAGGPTPGHVQIKAAGETKPQAIAGACGLRAVHGRRGCSPVAASCPHPRWAHVDLTPCAAGGRACPCAWSGGESPNPSPSLGVCARRRCPRLSCWGLALRHRHRGQQHEPGPEGCVATSDVIAFGGRLSWRVPGGSREGVGRGGPLSGVCDP
jgi:hypothetical protein